MLSTFAKSKTSEESSAQSSPNAEAEDPDRAKDFDVSEEPAYARSTNSSRESTQAEERSGGEKSKCRKSETNRRELEREDVCGGGSAPE